MSPSRLRIAVIGTRGIPGAYSGVERVAEHLYPLLAERGHEVTVYCRSGTLTDASDTYRGVHRVWLPALRHRSLETLSHNLLSTGHALLRNRYDLIQFEALAAGMLSAAGGLRSIPTVVRVHGLDWQRAKWGKLASRVLKAGEVASVRHADEVIVVSRDLKDYFARVYGRDVLHIPNGVGGGVRTPYGESGVLGEFGLEPKRYLVFVGRLVPEKRVEDLILAFRGLGGALRLAIVGESSYTDAYVARLRGLAAPDPRVVFTGFQGGAALEALLANAAVFSSPSELEGLPMSVLECLERSVPAVVSDIPPHRELLENVEGYDLFHAPGDVPALTARLQRVLDEPEWSRRIAARAADHVRSAFSWTAIADRTEEALVAVVERFRQSATARPRRGSPFGASASAGRVT